MGNEPRKPAFWLPPGHRSRQNQGIRGWRREKGYRATKGVLASNYFTVNQPLNLPGPLAHNIMYHIKNGI
jgi:hypothetical protein